MRRASGRLSLLFALALAITSSSQGLAAMAAPLPRVPALRSQEWSISLHPPGVQTAAETTGAMPGHARAHAHAVQDAKRWIVTVSTLIRRDASWLAGGGKVQGAEPRFQIVEARRRLADVRIASLRMRGTSRSLRKLAYDPGRQAKAAATGSAQATTNDIFPPGVPGIARIEEGRRELRVVRAELTRSSVELVRHERVLVERLLNARRSIARAKAAWRLAQGREVTQWTYGPNSCMRAPVSGVYSDCALASLASSAGWEGGDLVVAVAVALAESGGFPGAVSLNSNGTRDEGLWQINSVHGYAARCTLQARCNADLAFALYEADGRSFSSWTTYESGRYMAFIERAHAAAGSLEGSEGAWICPVDPPLRFSDDFGAPRYGGGYHSHEGNDIFAPAGTPVRAPFAGIAVEAPSGLGGLGVRVEGPLGYVYNAHLSGYGTLGLVAAGDVVGYVGNTGNAATTPPHNHFEWHPNDGSAVDPYFRLLAAC